MMQFILKTSRPAVSAPASLLALAFLALPVAAQVGNQGGRFNDEFEDVASAGAGTERRNDSAGETAEAGAKVIPTIRTIVYDMLGKAQVCMDEGDLECAADELEDVARRRDLNNYEIAQMWNFRAFLFFELDDIDGAVGAYETILALPHSDMPDGMIQSTMRNLSTLYLQQENYASGLETFLRWMDLPGVMVSSRDYYLLATIYYQMERFAEGIPAIQQAIELANGRGEIGEESWYQLLYVFYFQLEQTDKVIETLVFMVEHWTKKTWVMALAGQLSGEERDNETLTLYEAAYDEGWLERGPEFVQLASLYLNARTPYKAAVVLDEGLNSGVIESNESNWRLQATAWQLAQEHQRAIPAFERASPLAEDGEVDRLLVQSLIRMAEWEECVVASRRALDRDLQRPDLVYLYLGQCLMTIQRFEEARTAFQSAGRADERSERDAARFVTYVNTLIARDRSNREALANLALGN